MVVDRIMTAEDGIYTNGGAYSYLNLLLYLIEKNRNRKTAVLASQVALSRRTFERRFKKSTANTVYEYVQRIKVETAKKQLEMGRKTVSEVMYDAGYSDTKSFRDLFKRVAGM